MATMKDLDKMTVGELKRALESRGIDYRDCVEKRDLLNRLAEDVRAEDARGVGVQARPGGLTAPERQLVELFERCAPSVARRGARKIRRLRRRPTKPEPVPAGIWSSESGESCSLFTVWMKVWDKLGHVVTNFHVIAEAARQHGGGARVTLRRGTEVYEASLVGAEPEKDLAVLKVAAPKEELHPISVGSSADLLVGQTVVAIGNPFGLDNTLTTGVVSALGREVMGVGGRPITGLVQTDAAINPGNSGGPLLDSSGRLIGVNTAIISPAGASVGIGFAIPVDTVRRVVNQIVRHGRVQRPSLGVQVAVDQILRDLSRRLGTPLEGALVMSVTEGSPAQRAGVRGTSRSGAGAVELGDVITAVAGAPVRQMEDLLSAVEERRVGEVVEVAVLRGAGAAGKPKSLSLRIQLVEREQLQLQARPGVRRPRL